MPAYSGICLDPIPSKKNVVKVGPPLTKFSGYAHVLGSKHFLLVPDTNWHAFNTDHTDYNQLTI